MNVAPHTKCYKNINIAIVTIFLLIKRLNLFIKYFLDKIGFMCYTIYRIIKEVVIMTHKEKEELFWKCIHYGEVLTAKDFDFTSDNIYITFFLVKYNGKRYIFIKRNGEVIHYEEIKED